MTKRPLADMVQITARVPRGNEGFWSIIRGLDAEGPWTLRQVDDRSNVDRARVRDYVKRLELGGIAQRVGEAKAARGVNAANVYRLLKAPFEAPRLDRHGRPLRETATQLLWRSMRILKTFTARELRESAELDDHSIALTTTRNYLHALEQVDILASGSVAGSKTRCFRLLRDVGPKAPSVSSSLIVFDPNSRQVIGQPEIRVVS